jgi:hypothetical protein
VIKVKKPSQETYVEAMHLLQTLLDDIQADGEVEPLVETLLGRAQVGLKEGRAREPQRQLARAYRVAEDPWKKQIGEVLVSLR